MNWLQRLAETYDNSTDAIGKIEIRRYGKKEAQLAPLLPICHTMQNAHIEVTLDGAANFLRAKVVDKADAPTLIPCTESSAGRTSGQCPHPLHDKLEYLAKDYYERTGNKCDFESYIKQLNDWTLADKNANPKLVAIHDYLKKGSLITDCIQHKIIFSDDSGRLLNEWNQGSETPLIFKILSGGKDAKGKEKPAQKNAFVRFSVETEDSLTATIQYDEKLWQSWARHYTSAAGKQISCCITNNTVTLAEQHPAKIRNAGDKAKLISANDGSGFTFRGRFLDANQACSISFEITQKAHNALRWLLARQGRKFGDQHIVAWSTNGVTLPDPFKSSFDLFISPSDDSVNEDLAESDNKVSLRKKKLNVLAVVHTAQQFAEKLNNMIGGYGIYFADEETHRIVIMSIDSATPGRMAIRYYRELRGSEFLDRIRAWHENCSWHQYFGRDKQFVGAPAPKDIAEAAYGRKLDTKNKLLGTTVSRLLPCIIDSVPIPRDLVECCVHRATQRISMEFWEWSKALGIACALYKNQYKERKYHMKYEEGRNSRDYLYGSLLAVAEHIEERALYLAREKRDTHAIKLMQRFAERPFSTWRTIELQLIPCQTRLKNNRPSVYQRLRALLDTLTSRFETADDFTSDKPLSGEFLLGYHLLRKQLWEDAKSSSDPEVKEMEEIVLDQSESK